MKVGDKVNGGKVVLISLMDHGYGIGRYATIAMPAGQTTQFIKL